RLSQGSNCFDTATGRAGVDSCDAPKPQQLFEGSSLFRTASSERTIKVITRPFVHQLRLRVAQQQDGIGVELFVLQMLLSQINEFAIRLVAQHFPSAFE